MALPVREASRNSTRPSATGCFSTPTRPTLADRAGDPRQAGRLAQPVHSLQLHHRRPRRRARHARIQFRPRRAARRGGARLPRRQGGLAIAHEDDLLRQGASGRGLRRHLLLVAEPARGDGAERRARRADPGRPNAGRDWQDETISSFLRIAALLVAACAAMPPAGAPDFAPNFQRRARHRPRRRAAGRRPG